MSARLFERECDAATEYQKPESSSSSLMKKDEEDEGDGLESCASKSVSDGRDETEWKSRGNDADDFRGAKGDSSMSVTKKEGDGSGKVDLKKGSARWLAKRNGGWIRCVLNNVINWSLVLRWWCMERRRAAAIGRVQVELDGIG